MDINQSEKNIDRTSVTPTDDISTSTIISNILNKYGLIETDEEMAKKNFGDVTSETNSEVLFWISIKFVNGEVSEKDLSSVLKERLKISQKIAEEITEDIKKILLPVFKKPKEKTRETIKETAIEINESDILTKIKSPIEVEKILKGKQALRENTKPEKPQEIKKYSEKNKNMESSSINNKKVAEKSNGQDTYRESI